ncbi:NAD(P)H-dependent oxidoreductase [Bacteroidota bacterium]
MPAKKSNILIIYAHPAGHKSRINAAMIAKAKEVEGVSVRELYDIYPDFYIEIKKEQEALVANDIIIWQHPFYWYSAPPLLKEWIDLVLQHNFAFGKDGNALKGKKIFTAATTGGSYEAYSEGGHNHFTVNQLLAPFEATARLCKMQYLPPFIIHGSLLISDKEINSAAEEYYTLLSALRNGLFDDDEITKHQYINHMIR